MKASRSVHSGLPPHFGTALQVTLCACTIVLDALSAASDLHASAFLCDSARTMSKALGYLQNAWWSRPGILDAPDIANYLNLLW